MFEVSPGVPQDKEREKGLSQLSVQTLPTFLLHSSGVPLLSSDLKVARKFKIVLQHMQDEGSSSNLLKYSMNI